MDFAFDPTLLLIKYFIFIVHGHAFVAARIPALQGIPLCESDGKLDSDLHSIALPLHVALHIVPIHAHVAA